MAFHFSKTMALSEVKSHFPEVVKAVEGREEEVVVTKNGRPAAIILNYAEFQRYRETVDILSDPEMMKQIEKSRKYYCKRKKGLTFEDVFGESLA